MEIWNDLPGYAGFYQVSTCGRVRSVHRIDRMGKTRYSKIIRPTLDGGGYRKISLSKNGAIKTAKVGRLVALAFLPKPVGKVQVDHIDRNRQNDDATNLRWVTRSENQNNRTVVGSSKYNGVHWSPGVQRWIASVGENGQKTYLGCYSTEVAAARAFNTYVQRKNLGRVLNTLD